VLIAALQTAETIAALTGDVLPQAHVSVMVGMKVLIALLLLALCSVCMDVATNKMDAHASLAGRVLVVTRPPATMTALATELVWDLENADALTGMRVLTAVLFGHLSHVSRTAIAWWQNGTLMQTTFPILSFPALRDGKEALATSQFVPTDAQAMVAAPSQEFVFATKTTRALTAAL